MTLVLEYPSSQKAIDSSKVKDIDALTSLRAIAALMVFIHHFSGFPNYPTAASNIWQVLIIEGHVGVTIFFVLSGFLFTVRYLDVAIQGQLNLYDFFIKRAARVYPLYFFILFITLLGTQQNLFSSTSVISWTLSQGFFTSRVFDNVITAWSLTTEECFYLLIPLIFFTVRKFAQNMQSSKREILTISGILVIWSIGIALVGLGLMIVSKTLNLTQPYGFMTDLRTLIYTTIFFRFPQFAFGIICARIYQHYLIKRDYTIIARILLVVSVVGIVLSMYLMNQADGVFQKGWIYNFTAAIFAGLLITALTCKSLWISKILSLAPFVYLGKISYALYLVQGGQLFERLITLPNTLAWIAAKYGATSVISAFLYELVEKPGSRFVKSISTRLHTRYLNRKTTSAYEASQTL